MQVPTTAPAVRHSKSDRWLHQIEECLVPCVDRADVRGRKTPFGLVSTGGSSWLEGDYPAPQR